MAIMTRGKGAGRANHAAWVSKRSCGCAVTLIDVQQLKAPSRHHEKRTKRSFGARHWQQRTGNDHHTRCGGCGVSGRAPDASNQSTVCELMFIFTLKHHVEVMENQTVDPGARHCQLKGRNDHHTRKKGCGSSSRAPEMSKRSTVCEVKLISTLKHYVDIMRSEKLSNKPPLCEVKPIGTLKHVGVRHGRGRGGPPECGIDIERVEMTTTPKINGVER